jgi:hypothetical protein
VPGSKRSRRSEPSRQLFEVDERGVKHVHRSRLIDSHHSDSCGSLVRHTLACSVFLQISRLSNRYLSGN